MGRKVNSVASDQGDVESAADEVVDSMSAETAHASAVENRLANANYKSPQQAAVEAVTLKKYRVAKTARYVSHGSGVCTMHEGKILDEGQYDIAHIKNQGIKLEELT